MNTFYIFILTSVFELYSCGKEEDEGVKYANKCEVCKIVSKELVSRLSETGKTSDVIETGYSIDQKGKKRTKYKTSASYSFSLRRITDITDCLKSYSDLRTECKFKRNSVTDEMLHFVLRELRLVETLDNICERILQYNIHKERTDSTRFAKGMSQTFQTLHNLVNKGVKVELGMPYELWDKPSAEITNMKTQCETLIEDYEGDIEDWYFNHQHNMSLEKFLCSDRVLRNDNDKCLFEIESQSKGESKTKDEL